MAEKTGELKDQGKNHEITLSLDTAKRSIRGGAVYNFSDNSSVSLNFTGGMLDGSLVHAGEEHSLKLELNRDGRYSGTYRDKDLGGVDLEISAGVAKVSGGKFPPDGKIRIRGKKRELELDIDGKGRLSGKIKSGITGSSVFDLEIRNGIVSGQFVHKGKRHKTLMKLSNRGWKGEITVRKGGSTLTFGVTGGKDLRLSSAKIKAIIDF